MRLTKTVAGLVAAAAALALGVPGTAVAADGSDSGWQQPVVLDQGARFTEVSCASSAFCVAIRSDGYAWILNAGTWTPAVPVHAGVATGGISCVSSTFCMAVDAVGDYEVYDGTTWSKPKQVQAATDLTAVSCASAAMCVAGDKQGDVYLYGKGGWAAGQDVGLNGPVTGISCAAETFCMATGVDDSSSYDGRSWSAVLPTDSRLIAGVSCGIPGVCVAIDQESRFVNYRHGAWSHRHKAEPRFRETTGVSCAAGDFCAIVDDQEHAMVRDGHGYGKPQRIDTDQQPGDGWAQVSCPTTSFCMAVDWAGDAIEYTG